MAEEIIKVKVPDLPTATTLDGFFAFGVDGSNRSVKTPIEMLKGNTGARGEKGDTGSNIELQKTTTHVQWRVVGGTWANLIPLSDLKGDKGDNISLQKTTTHIQWRLGTGAWNNLVSLSELKGEKGDAPVKGVDYFDGKNAVMTIGTITTVASNAQANATVEADGVDAEGKPKFKLNLWLPKGVDGEAAGDMLKSVYDQTGKNTDVFGYVDNKVKTDVPVNAKFTDTTYENATTSVSGLMSSADKSKLDGVEAGANKYVHPAGTNPHGTTKADVGLGNVDNTSDANKPVSTATQTALNGKLDANKMQIVTELPASPVSGVFYFVKE